MERDRHLRNLHKKSQNYVINAFKSNLIFLFRMLRNKKTKKNWNEDDIDILVWVLNKYGAYYIKTSVH